MFPIAIVGEASVVIRAVGDKLEGDIQRALNRSARGARASGEEAGDQFGAGLEKGIEDRDLGRKLIPEKEVDSAGLEIGKRLGDQVGRGVERSRLRSSFARSFLKLGVVIPIIGTLVGGISTLVSGLFAVVAAAGTASSSLIVFPGILASIGQGAVVAAVGFQGVGKAIAAGFDPSNAAAFQKELAKLPPSAREFVKEFVKMRDAIKEIRVAAADGLFSGPNGLTAQLEKIEPLLPKIAAGFRETGRALSSGIGSAIDRLTTQNALTNFGTVARTNNRVIRDLGKTFGNLGAAIIATLGAAGPVIVQFSGWLVDFTQRLRESTEVNTADGTLTNYFKEAAETAKVFIDVIKNISIGLYEIGQIAQPFGLDLIERLRTATEELANFTDKEENVQRLKDAFSQIHANMLEISALVKDLGAAFLRIGASPAVGEVAAALRDIVPELEAMLTASLKMVPSLVALIGSLAELFTILEELGVIEFVVKTLDALVTVLNTVLRAAGPLLGPLLKVYFTMRLIKGLGFIIGGRAGAGMVSMGKQARFLGGILQALGMVILPQVAKAVGFLVTAFLKFTPIGKVISLIVLLGSALVTAYQQSETFRGIVNSIWSSIQSAASSVVDWFQGSALPALQAVWDGLKSAWEGLKAAGDVVWNAIKTAFSAVWTAIQAIWNAVGAPIFKIIQVAFIVWVNIFKAAFTIIGGAFWLLWQGIKLAWDTVGVPLFELIKAYLGLWLAGLTVFWNLIKAGFQLLWDGMAALWVAVGEPIFTSVKDKVMATIDFLQAGWEAIKIGWNSLWESVSAFWQEYGAPIWDTIVEKFNSFSESVGEIVERVKGWLAGMWDGITERAEAAWGGVASFINRIIRAANKAIDGVNAIASVTGIGGGVSHIPEIPGYARGTSHYPGGWGFVGEEGPELVRLPVGSQIFPNRKTNQMMSSVSSSTDNRKFEIINNFLGATTGSSRNNELEWTLRYATTTSAPSGGAGGML